MTDHEINLWCARFMGWRELRREDYRSDADYFQEIGESVLADNPAFVVREGRVQVFGCRENIHDSLWEPIRRPGQAVMVMARAAMHGIVISPIMDYGAVRDNFARSMGEDLSVVDGDEGALILAWCRLVCTRIMKRVKES